MKWHRIRLIAFMTVVALGVGISAQPGGEKGEKGKGDKAKGGKKGFELGKVLPPFIRDGLDLTEDQQKKIADLEAEVTEKLRKILTEEQRKKIQEMGPPDGKKGGDGPPDKKGKGKGPPDGKDGKAKDGDKLPDRPPLEDEKGKPKATTNNLVKNPVFAAATDGRPDHYALEGEAEWTHAGARFEFGHRGIAFHSGKGTHAGSVAQEVTAFSPGRGQWFRFAFRGLAENDFAVKDDGLFMKVEFHGNAGSLDAVTRQLYPQVEKDRRELAVNGKFRRGGGAVWKTYAHDFMLPFAEINRLRLVVGFRDGIASNASGSQFYVTEMSLTSIPDPMIRPRVAQGPKGTTVAPADLVSLGGRWYYQPETPGDKMKPAKLTIDHRNADRLFYLDHQLVNPFAENMSAWLLKGYKDISGNIVTEDRFVPDNILLRFEDDKTLIVHAKNLPNHPTATFPAPRGSGDKNPSYIQEHAYTYYLPLNPTRNPDAVAMDKTNSNRALPMGAIGIATNGVVFYNPFDIGQTDATNFMDRCCGHPSPDNRYHYHKYPVCVKSPFVDEGDSHSPLIGFAFDGFPIYGPYEGKSLMAKDAGDHALNDFNMHFDEVRGWHYHATPGRYPYILGGYWGVVDERNQGKKGGAKKKF